MNCTERDDRTGDYQGHMSGLQGQLTHPSVSSTLSSTCTSNTHATHLFIQIRNKDNWFWTDVGFIWLQPGNVRGGLR